MNNTTATKFFYKLPPLPLPQPQFLDFVHHDSNRYHNYWIEITTTTTKTQVFGICDHKMWFTTIMPSLIKISINIKQGNENSSLHLILRIRNLLTNLTKLALLTLALSRIWHTLPQLNPTKLS